MYPRVALLLVLVTSVTFAQSSKSAKKTSSGSNLQATLEKLEKDGWEAYGKTHDANAFKQLCAPEYTAVEADRGPVRDLQATLDAMKSFDLNSYSFSDVKATPLGPDAALLTYIAKVNMNIDGKPQDAKLAVTDVYVKRGGQWKALRYHESELK